MRSVVIGSSASGSSRCSSSRASWECLRSQRCSGSMAVNTSGLSAIEISAPARIRLLPLVGQHAQRSAERREDERELADLRQAGRHRERGVQRIAQQQHQQRGSDRLADHDDRHAPPARAAARRPAPAGRTACRPTRRTAPRTHRAAAATPRAARWLNCDSRSTMPAKNAPSANDTPNSCAEPHAMLTAAATTHSVNSSREPVRVTCHSSHGNTRRPTSSISATKPATLSSVTASVRPQLLRRDVCTAAEQPAPAAAAAPAPAPSRGPRPPASRRRCDR